MKKQHVIILVFFFMLSCVSEKKATHKNYLQKWMLSKMTGQMPNSETTGDDMAWQEYYLLQSDGTFTKQRIKDGVQSEGTGVYSFILSDDGKYLELVYKVQSEIIGSCLSNQKETLWLNKNKLISTWQACDGPGLEYKHVK